MKWYEKMALSVAEWALERMMDRVEDEELWHHLFAAATRIGYLLDKIEK